MGFRSIPTGFKFLVGFGPPIDTQIAKGKEWRIRSWARNGWLLVVIEIHQTRPRNFRTWVGLKITRPENGVAFPLNKKGPICLVQQPTPPGTSTRSHFRAKAPGTVLKPSTCGTNRNLTIPWRQICREPLGFGQILRRSSDLMVEVKKKRSQLKGSDEFQTGTPFEQSLKGSQQHTMQLAPFSVSRPVSNRAQFYTGNVKKSSQASCLPFPCPLFGWRELGGLGLCVVLGARVSKRAELRIVWAGLRRPCSGFRVCLRMVYKWFGGYGWLFFWLFF